MAKRPSVRTEIKPRYHPSGRPLREDRTRGHSIYRVPPDGPLTPGLRPGRERSYAVGFMAQLSASDDDE